jgi:putative transposase
VREELEGGVHHVFARGNDRRRIYRDDVDFLTYLGMLGRVVDRMRWSCLAYCLMDNHLHLLVETPRANLGVGMQRLHGSYAQSFNERHGRSGHVFQGRYGSTRIEHDEQLLTAVGYIARNPSKAGLCDQPAEWRWNSYRDVLHDSAPAWLDVSRLLGYLGALGGEPRRRYADLVADMGATGFKPATSRVMKRALSD